MHFTELQRRRLFGTMSRIGLLRLAEDQVQLTDEGEVRARSVETGAVRAASTGSAGRFEIPDLAPGEYTIEVQAAGFAMARHAVRLEVGQNMRLDLGLTIGEAKTSVDVSSNQRDAAYSYLVS